MMFATVMRRYRKTMAVRKPMLPSEECSAIGRLASLRVVPLSIESYGACLEFVSNRGEGSWVVQATSPATLAFAIGKSGPGSNTSTPIRITESAFRIQLTLMETIQKIGFC